MPPKAATTEKRLTNNYTGDVFVVLGEKHPQGGLYLYLLNERTGQKETFHRSNLKSCFSSLS